MVPHDLIGRFLQGGLQLRGAAPDNNRHVQVGIGTGLAPDPGALDDHGLQPLPRSLFQAGLQFQNNILVGLAQHNFCLIWFWFQDIPLCFTHPLMAAQTLSNPPSPTGFPLIRPR